jgi:hypothetical protein
MGKVSNIFLLKKQEITKINLWEKLVVKSKKIVVEWGKIATQDKKG